MEDVKRDEGRKHWRFSTNKSPYFRNGARELGPRLLLITNISTSAWFEIDLEWPWTTVGYCNFYCTNDASFEAHNINLKIDPQYQRLKCSPGILLSGSIRFDFIDFFPVTLKYLTLNDLEMPFYAKICFHCRFDKTFLPRFRRQLCKNERRYCHTVSDKNVHQGP